jgi:hypothetical protein
MQHRWCWSLAKYSTEIMHLLMTQNKMDFQALENEKKCFNTKWNEYDHKLNFDDGEITFKLEMI